MKGGTEGGRRETCVAFAENMELFGNHCLRYNPQATLLGELSQKNAHLKKNRLLGGNIFKTLQVSLVTSTRIQDGK